MHRNKRVQVKSKTLLYIFFLISRTLKRIKRVRMSKKVELPSDKDMCAMWNGCKTICINLTKELKKFRNFKKKGKILICVCVVLFILFNRKRAGKLFFKFKLRSYTLPDCTLIITYLGKIEFEKSNWMNLIFCLFQS